MLAEIAAGDTARVDLCRLLPPDHDGGYAPKPPLRADPRAGGPRALVAVKRLHPHLAEDQTFVKQFLDEVRITYWLRHPNVVEVVGWGIDAQGSYLAVELVQGVSLLRLLKTIIDTGEAFPERMVVHVASRICAGLGAAHALRAPNGEMLHLVHRDLTPGNVLVGFNGEVKITDFGTAKAKQRLTKTITGMRKGEPTYMAPEQALDGEIDARADLFSLGVMLFELLAGRRPWIAKSDFEMVQITTRQPPADLRELRPKIDKELVLVVNRCLERDPAARFQSVSEIAARLDQWLDVHGYREGNDEALGRFVRRNAMRQMRWFERAIAGELSPEKVGHDGGRLPKPPTHTEPTARPPEESVTDERTPPPRTFLHTADLASDPSLPREPQAAPGPGHVSSHPPGLPGTAGRTLVPPRPGVERSNPPRPSATPADPRSIRAANVVQQLKKLAPPIEPPRGRERGRRPTPDDDGAPTDVHVRDGALGREAPTPVPPRIVHPEDEEDAGEEVPTLVQKGDAKLQALRAEARRKQDDTRGKQGASKRSGAATSIKRSYARPGGVVDEDSDQLVTEVKGDEPRQAAPPVEDGSAHATLSSGAKPPPDPGESPTPIAAPKPRFPPVRQVIPPSPDVPRRPFPIGPSVPTNKSLAGPLRSPGSVHPPPAAPSPYPDAERPRSDRTTARPQSFPSLPPGAPASMGPQAAPNPGPAGRAPPPEPEMPSAGAAPHPGSPQGVSHYDDVQVLDRGAFQHSAPMSEEAVVAEADRLSIEAVRLNEEARAAQVRAERKLAAAKLAGDAARIAGDAVRILHSSGLSAAVRRLDEAHALEQSLQSGKIPSADVMAVLRADHDAAARSPVPPPYAPPAPEARPPGFVPSIPPMPPAPPLAAVTMGGDPPYPPARPAGTIRPAAPQAPPTMRPAAPALAPDVRQPPPVTMEADAFRANLKPAILGLPFAVVAGIGAVGLGVLLVLLLLLAK